MEELQYGGHYWMGPIIKLILPKIMNLVLGEVAGMIKPLQKYVHEENELDIEVMKLKSRIDTLQELLLETQSDVVVLQKARTKKRKKRKG